MTNPRVFTFTVAIDSIISIGDYLYYLNEFTNSPALAVVITTKYSTTITVYSTINGATNPTTNTPFMMALKNSIAESNAVLVHEALMTL